MLRDPATLVTAVGYLVIAIVASAVAVRIAAKKQLEDLKREIRSGFDQAERTLPTRVNPRWRHSQISRPR